VPINQFRLGTPPGSTDLRMKDLTRRKKSVNGRLGRRTFCNVVAAVSGMWFVPAIAKEKNMSSARHVETVRSLIQEFFNKHDPSVASQYFTPDFKWHGGSVGDYQGVENYAKALAGFFKALPDVRAMEQDVIATGDTVVVRFVVEGTHAGELWGIQPSSKKVRWDATMIYRFKGDKIAEQWAAEDWTAILRDIGFVKPPFGRAQ
jgi:predicted ester cyclase